MRWLIGAGLFGFATATFTTGALPAAGSNPATNLLVVTTSGFMNYDNTGVRDMLIRNVPGYGIELNNNMIFGWNGNIDAAASDTVLTRDGIAGGVGPRPSRL